MSDLGAIRAASTGFGVDPGFPCVFIHWDGTPKGHGGEYGRDAQGNYHDPVHLWVRKVDEVLGIYYENAASPGNVIIFYSDGSVGEYAGGSQTRAGTWSAC